ncbi:N-formylglutamate amidohydrolase [Thermaurantiacus tibetensis]|uniref:N-formylglutamate amidohydrolase n=1 Tax=Thermaurantiacus tibetensis TaxID=2759035 RepID=UPI00188E412E|nr:N-formylglutamate amidohydrolase [Thermaurantiacus tibetensis]
MEAHRLVQGARRDLLLVCDHAANAVPPGVDLGVPPSLLLDHVAWDIGAGALTEALARLLDAPACLGAWSRLVVDCNRPPDLAIPASSDGHAIPGNQALAAAERRFRLALHAAFHEALAREVAARQPRLLVSVHSFTPALATDPSPRPWPVAVLWNRDARGAELALAALRADSRVPGPIGANEPYSGRVLNYTMDRHAEANGIAYIGFEVRQDLLGSAPGMAAWAAILADAFRAALAGLP